MSRQARLNELGVRWRSGPSEASSSSSQPAMRQGTITGLQGVRNWKDEAESAAVEGLSDIPSTLYLGQEDVEKLRGMLNEASARGDSGALKAVLRRLSGMPTTRAQLQATKIGVTVGHLRKHDDKAVSDLASRLVRVWKAQLKEQPPSKPRAAPPATTYSTPRGTQSQTTGKRPRDDWQRPPAR